MLDTDLAAYRYRQVILVLGDPARRREYPPEASYHLGEAYRLRGEGGDIERAEREYLACVETAPRFAPAYRALGLLHFKRNEPVLAVMRLRRYLELAPAAADRAHIETYLSALEHPVPAAP